MSDKNTTLPPMTQLMAASNCPCLTVITVSLCTTSCFSIEKAYRVTKGTLEMRPMFHFTSKRIEAHVCICFVAYKVYKELERILKIRATFTVALFFILIVQISKPFHHQILVAPIFEYFHRNI